MKKNGEDKNNVEAILGADKPKSILRKKRFWIIAAAILLFLLVFLLMGKQNNKAGIQFKTEEIKRGNLVVKVSATGTIEPLNQVDVGTEISGTIKTVAVDYNDQVKAGQMLAELDTTKLEAQVLQSKAALSSAKANLLEAQASVEKAGNNLKRMQKTWELSGGKVPSQNDLEEADIALKSAKAQEAAARAQVDQAQASLDSNQTDLTKAIIRSPIDGIILERDVEPGQTVAASLQTPVLFTLAEDLTRMELQVDVDEADIGQVLEGQEATFTVDAYPNRSFEAIITKVRFAPQTEDGVVTYKTSLLVDNSDLLLRPGMTATADIVVDSVEDALLVPNAALRFTPPEINADQTEQKRGLVESLFPRPPRRSSKSKTNGSSNNKGSAQIWILRDNMPSPVSVDSVSSDGVMTAIHNNGIKAGDKVIVGSMRSEQ